MLLFDSQLLLSSQVRQREIPRLWGELISGSLMKLNCAVHDECFAGRIDSCGTRAMPVFEVAAGAQTATRTRQHIARTQDDFVLLCLLLEGRGCFEQLGRRTFLEPGDFVVNDSLQASVLSFGGPFKSLVYKLPRAGFAARLGDLSLVAGTVVSGASGVGSLAADLLRGFAQQRHALTGEVSSVVGETVLDLVTLAYRNALRSELGDRRPGRAAHLLCLKSFIHDNLRNPDLSAVYIAKANRISLRYLHLLFEAEGTSVTHYVTQKRLEKTASELRDATHSYRSIEDVAWSWGFKNAAHFSRRFKSHYGVSPRIWRASIST